MSAAEFKGKKGLARLWNALGYSRYSPYGFNGRFVFARMAYNW